MIRRLLRIEGDRKRGLKSFLPVLTQEEEEIERQRRPAKRRQCHVSLTKVVGLVVDVMLFCYVMGRIGLSETLICAGPICAG